jgi:hypothetical protein
MVLATACPVGYTFPDYQSLPLRVSLHLFPSLNVALTSPQDNSLDAEDLDKFHDELEQAGTKLPELVRLFEKMYVDNVRKEAYFSARLAELHRAMGSLTVACALYEEVCSLSLA